MELALWICLATKAQSAKDSNSSRLDDYSICFMVLFLLSSAKLSTCYSYVGIALRSSLRLGLHCKVATDFNPIERELRKRIFWVVRKMDVYYPMEIDGNFITTEGINQQPSNYTPLMAGCNAHTRLSNTILKVVKYIYPVKNTQYRSKSDQCYMVSHSKIREIERDLQNWMEELPPALRPGTEVSPQLELIRQLLHISYAHVQMVMYRPFLHYVSGGSQARGVDKRSYACAAACDGVLKDAMEGKHTLASLAKKSLAADRCSQSLNSLFKTLPEMLKNRQSSKTPVNLKRSAPFNQTAETEPVQSSFEKTLPHRSSTFTMQKMPQTPAPEVTTRRQQSLDNTQMMDNRPNENSSRSTWISTTPELLTKTMSTPEQISSASSMNPSMPSNQEPSSLAWAQHFANLADLPDFMPIMFPSDDPFGYPTQPMSTLEDDHFCHDRGMIPSQYPCDAAPQTTGMGTTTPTDPRGALESLPRPLTLPISLISSAGIPRRLSHQCQTVSKPSIPEARHNHVWQGYNFQPTKPNNPKNIPTEFAPQQDFPSPNGHSNASMGMGMELGISFDDLFGNNATFRPNNGACNGACNDDWAQWMDANV
ncbi:hypothetical protein N7471_001901 [Penicillium samsonianum]|uniref:uncharacterized protein n=1 Tax=Penicillium samsonianum TaxID=1882272 RepID=UPI002546C4BB|nr:uncharacterized protein N7471_001901 [Penicillium samsonianum]KAJ6142448.1 hypothetical protein N7471_001901 [Penicillium samsonianum]